MVATALAAFLLYLPSLRSDFVYDAGAQIEQDDYLHVAAHGWDIVTLRVLAQDVLDGARPVHLFSLWLDARLWGREPFGYHLTSQLLHALTCALLVLLMARLAEGSGGSSPGGLTSGAFAGVVLGALFFAVHPVNVEAVAEVSYREDVLATLFLVGGLCLATYYPGGSGGWRAAGMGAACVLAMVLAAGSKETGFAGPWLLLLYAGLYRRSAWDRRWTALVAAVFAAVGGLALARVALAPEVSEIFREKPGYLGGSLAAVFGIQPRLWAFLAGKLVAPFGLSADYMPQDVAGVTLGGALAALAAVAALQAWLSWRSRMACVGTAMFWLGLAPVSNFVPLFRPLADRFLYLPSAGAALLLASVFALLPWRRRGMRAAVAACAVFIGMLAVLAWQRQEVFASSLNLWRDTLRKSPASETAANNLGFAQYDAGDLEGARGTFLLLLESTQARKAEAWLGLALIAEREGRAAEAEAAMRRALALDARYARPLALVASMDLTEANAQVLDGIVRRVRP